MGQLTEPIIQLLKGKNFASLVTLMNDGSPQVTPTWIDLDEDSDNLLISTVEGRIKHKNVSIDPRVAICISDENNPYNMVLIRGRVSTHCHVHFGHINNDLEQGSYGLLKRRVRYAIVSATVRYPIIAIKLPIVEAMKGW
jgi:hypothetical protein